jgi:hypothetical protein
MMRAGILFSAAVAIAALATAGLISADFLGRPRTRAVSNPAPATDVAPAATTTAAPVAAAVSPPVIVSPPPIAAPVEPAAPPARVEETQVSAPPQTAKPETTGTIQRSVELVVTGSRVALRAEPSTKAMVVERMANGQRLIEISRQGDWLQVRLQPSNAEGWVNAALVGRRSD